MQSLVSISEQKGCASSEKVWGEKRTRKTKAVKLVVRAEKAIVVTTGRLVLNQFKIMCITDRHDVVRSAGY